MQVEEKKVEIMCVCVCMCVLYLHRVALCTSVNIVTLAQIATEYLKAVNQSRLNIKIFVKCTVTQNCTLLYFTLLY